MRMQIPLTALGLALVAGAPTANAQTVITRGITDQPVETVVTQRPSGTLVSEEPLVPVPSGTLAAQPVETIKTVETVRTVRPVRTLRTTRPVIHPAARPVPRVATRSVVRHQVVTTRQTVVRQRVVPTQTVVARSVQYSQPIYDEAAPAPVVTAPAYPSPSYEQPAPAPIADAYPSQPLYDAAYPSRPLYDEVVPAPVPPAPVVAPVAEETIVDTPVTPAAVVAPPSTAVGFYRYVYEPHRILVIDPTTNVAVQAIPR